MKTFSLTIATLVFATVLAGFAASCGSGGQQPEPGAPPEGTVPTSLPEEDVSGDDIPDLPRYPDSVRVEYERGEEDGPSTTRVRYLTTDDIDAVREFYRGVFQSEGWTEADTDFSGGTWTFFVTDDEREATVTIEPQDPLVEVGIELNESQPGEGITPEPAQPAPETAPSPPPSPAPQSTPDPFPAPTPIPDDDFDDDFDNDFDDD